MTRYTAEELMDRPECDEDGRPVLLGAIVRVERTSWAGRHGRIIAARMDGQYTVALQDEYRGGPHLLLRRCDFEVLP